MLTNDIKKGMRFQLACGWYGTMKDNMKGNIRFAEVEGFYTELGSVYAHDIISVETPNGWDDVEYTPAQNKLRLAVENALG